MGPELCKTLEIRLECIRVCVCVTPVAIGDTQGTLQARKTCVTPYKRPETLIWVYTWYSFKFVSIFCWSWNQSKWTIIPLWVLHHNVTEIWVVNVPMMLMFKPTMSPHDLEWPIAHQDCSSGKCSNVIWTKVCLSAQLHLSMWYHHLYILRITLPIIWQSHRFMNVTTKATAFLLKPPWCKISWTLIFIAQILHVKCYN